MAELNRQVAASADDCRVWWTGSAWAISTTHGRGAVGYWDSDQYKYGSGMRFTNIAIPQNATIIAAYLTLTSYSNYSVTTVNSKIRGEDADDAAQFSDITDYNGRARTTAEVLWDAIAAWTTNTEYNSPDIKTVIQEIIDREGWASGQAIVIFWDDHDDRSSHNSSCVRLPYAYDGSTTKCAKLHIEYTPPAAGGARSHGYIMG